MIEYLTQDFYYANRKIVNNINWLRTDEKYEYNASAHKFDNRYYVYRIDGLVFEKDSPLFQKYLEKELMWERLQA